MCQNFILFAVFFDTIKPGENGQSIANETLLHNKECSSLDCTLIDRKPTSFIILSITFIDHLKIF